MASDLSMVTGTQFLFNESGSYSPATLNDLEVAGHTDVALDLTSVAAGEAEASTKADLGANWAPEMAVHAAIEFATEPPTGTTVEFFWAPSLLAANGAGNPGYVSGTSAAYTGTPGTLAEGLTQLVRIGSLVLGADATGTIQMGFVGRFAPQTRYGMLVVHNPTADAFHSDAIEMAVSFSPIIPQGS
jgi:hypothetical protein